MDQLTPDDDSIKLFVGQIPYDMPESDLRKILEEYGTIHQLAMLKRNTMSGSKGVNHINIFYI